MSEFLAQEVSVFEKLAILNATSSVREFLRTHSFLVPFLAGLSPECEVALKQVMAIGQAESLFQGLNASNLSIDLLRTLLEKLVSIDHFYREIGGIFGYQKKILQLMKEDASQIPKADYHAPSFIDISDETPFVREAIEWGIESMPLMGEIYPLGGAADRLHLVDEKTGAELPAAKLTFAGRTLLEHLICDLQAREHLYFQRTGKRLITPLAIMTSYEKNNHVHVREVFENAHWFGRPQESIRFFTQPLVPTVRKDGSWVLQGPLQPLLKPGGHGALWKLARDEGVFSWFEKQGRTKALVRQINNPIAGLDYGLLAFTGYGCKKGMTFGFASCPRLLEAAEGVNVVIEKNNQIVLTNIEYCDFTKFGIEDKPLKEGEPYSQFSSNTNILFVDLQAVSKVVDTCPFPGLLVNLKKGAYSLQTGEKKEEPIARLESTMQNIADVFTEEKEESLQTKKTFVTYNKRHKTISTAKKAFTGPHSLKETPENCFYDLLTANRELLLDCGFSLPSKRSVEEYLQKGPEYLFLYHPILGPLYSLIREKMVGGSFSLGSEFFLELTHLKVKNLQLQGSLQIIAEKVTSAHQCVLENVTIQNKGVDWDRSKPFWKRELHRLETVKIILKGNARFVARNIHLKGNHLYVVEDGQELIL